MIVVVARLKTAEGEGDEFEQVCRDMVPKVLQEPGTLAYVLHRGLKDPSLFCFYEKYESKEALKEHGETPHFKEFSETIGPMLSGRPEIELYNEVS